MRNLLISLWSRVLEPRNLLIWLMSSIIAGYMGPFGTFILLDVIDRYLFWTVLTGWGLFLVAVAMSWAEVFFPNLTYRQEELGRAVIIPPVIVGTSYPAIHAYFAPLPVPLTVLEAVFACYLLAALVGSARIAIEYGVDTAGDATGKAAGPRAPRLMKRLPEGAAGPILRLSAKDHFVDIITPTDRHTVRMRLADAVAEMDGVEGVFTHRSHWVAKDAIREVKRAGTKHYVLAADSELVPVSRSNIDKLAELAP